MVTMGIHIDSLDMCFGTQLAKISHPIHIGVNLATQYFDTRDLARAMSLSFSAFRELLYAKGDLLSITYQGLSPDLGSLTSWP